MIIVIASAKGGSGKSTTAMHLAEYLSRRRSLGRVILLDADPDNQSATAWYAQGDNWRFELLGHEDDVPDNDALVVDSGAAPDGEELADLLNVADLLIVPTAPSFLDLQSAAQSVSIFENDDSVKVLVTLAPPGRSKAGDIAVQELQEAGISVCPQVIRRRAILSDVTALGTTVASLKSEAAKKAWAEYQEAFKELLGGLI